MQPNKFSLRLLSCGILCLGDDKAFPDRAEACGHMDIDGDKHRIARAVPLNKDSLVLDVGAFVGDTTSVFASYGSTVIGFEPFFDAALCAEHNCREFGGRVKIVNQPVGNGELVRLVHSCPGDNYGMRMVTTVPSNGDVVGALVTARLAELDLEGKVTFIKIDCEGREVEAIMGASELIKRDRPVIFVEVYPDALVKHGHTAEQLENILRSFGYELEMWGEPPRWDWMCRPKKEIVISLEPGENGIVPSSTGSTEQREEWMRRYDAAKESTK